MNLGRNVAICGKAIISAVATSVRYQVRENSLKYSLQLDFLKESFHHVGVDTDGRSYYRDHAEDRNHHPEPYRVITEVDYQGIENGDEYDYQRHGVNQHAEYEPENIEQGHNHPGRHRQPAGPIGQGSGDTRDGNKMAEDDRTGDKHHYHAGYSQAIPAGFNKTFPGDFPPRHADNQSADAADGPGLGGTEQTGKEATDSQGKKYDGVCQTGQGYQFLLPGRRRARRPGLTVNAGSIS